MPGMDGFELAELMRGSELRHVPIILVTAGVRDQHRLFQGYDIGAVDFLHKPIEPRIPAIKASVLPVMAKQQLVQELKERTETLRLNEMFVAVSVMIADAARRHHHRRAAARAARGDDLTRDRRARSPAASG
jgi:DNA-binding response OmpR family regulator